MYDRTSCVLASHGQEQKPGKHAVRMTALGLDDSISIFSTTTQRNPAPQLSLLPTRMVLLYILYIQHARISTNGLVTIKYCCTATYIHT